MRTTFTTAAPRKLHPQPGRAEAFHRRGLCFWGGHLAQHRGPIPLSADQRRAGRSAGLDGHRSIQPFPGRASGAYHQAEPAARIALISAEPHNPLADEFLKQSVFFETKVLAHLDKGVPLDQFKVLVMPADLPKLSAEQKGRLKRFIAAGGIIIRAGKAGSGIAARAEAASGGPGLTLEPRGYVLGQLTRKPDGQTFILHLLNYDRQVPAENVKVRLELSGLVDLRETKDLSGWEVKVLSPDTAQPQFADLCLHGSVADFTLDRIEHYTVVTLSVRPALQAGH